MTGGRTRTTDAVAVLMLWATVSLTAAFFPLPGDTAATLLAGALVTLIVVAVVVVGRADDLLVGLSRTPRGPTVEERRLRGAFRRHSHPDTAGRPRPRAPGPRAGGRDDSARLIGPRFLATATFPRKTWSRHAQFFTAHLRSAR